jgi:hypothetical protein
VAHQLTEFLVAGIFLAWAAVSLWADSPVLLAAGYAAHAAWDLAHHSRTRTVTTDVRSWYPPFCVAFDVLVAVFSMAWLPLGGTN